MSCNEEIIVLRQGDDSDFNGSTILVNINTDVDLSNWSARFTLQDYVQTFDDLSEKVIKLVFPKEETVKMQTGTFNGWLKLIDDESKEATVFTQKFRVLRKEAE